MSATITLREAAVRLKFGTTKKDLRRLKAALVAAQKGTKNTLLVRTRPGAWARVAWPDAARVLKRPIKEDVNQEEAVECLRSEMATIADNRIDVRVTPEIKKLKTALSSVRALALGLLKVTEL